MKFNIGDRVEYIFDYKKYNAVVAYLGADEDILIRVFDEDFMGHSANPNNNKSKLLFEKDKMWWTSNNSLKLILPSQSEELPVGKLVEVIVLSDENSEDFVNKELVKIVGVEKINNEYVYAVKDYFGNVKYSINRFRNPVVAEKDIVKILQGDTNMDKILPTKEYIVYKVGNNYITVVDKEKRNFNEKIVIANAKYEVLARPIKKKDTIMKNPFGMLSVSEIIKTNCDLGNDIYFKFKGLTSAQKKTFMKELDDLQIGIRWNQGQKPSNYPPRDLIRLRYTGLLNFIKYRITCVEPMLIPINSVVFSVANDSGKIIIVNKDFID